MFSLRLNEAAAFQAVLRRRFSQLIQLQLQDYDNTVLVASSAPLDPDQLAHDLRQSEVLGAAASRLEVSRPSPVSRHRLRRVQ
ncbi:unnamed protein product, partial [Symbiodinium pilosum]